MKLREFSKEVIGIMPSILVELARRQASPLMKERVTFPQIVIMNILRTRGECKMSDISKMLHTTKSATTGLTDRLIRAGILERERSKEDRRVVKIRLTPKGMSLSKRLDDHRLKMVSALFSNISQRERTAYLKILRKLQKNISARRGHKPHG